MPELDLYFDIKPTQWPIIYRPEYNVNFWGLEKLHPFDARKWGRVFQYLKSDDILDENNVVSPHEAKREHLLLVHSKKYLRSLNCSIFVAMIAELPPLCIVPNYFVQKCYLRRMRYQVGGSILAGKLALERGFAINIGGGFHHCSATKGAGFCPYADITLLIQYLFKYFHDKVKDVLIVDLDAHQGNGYEKDFIDNNNVHIMDVYNKHIYPRDRNVKSAITINVELNMMTEDKLFLQLVEENLDIALRQCRCDFVVYNAGTDILRSDPLGGLSISAEGIIKRDEMVFKKVRGLGIPIVMLTSGGYLRKSARIIADSIINLNKAGLIKGPPRKY